MLVYIKQQNRREKENQKSAQQRVTDFLQLEKTELFRNDLLKHNFKFQNTAVLRPRDQ
jgi:hypothetical protein